MAFQPRLTTLMAAAGLLFSAQAGAVLNLPKAANVEFVINGFTSGTFYSLVNGPICNSVATCDTAALPGNGGNQAPGSIGSEDSWGVTNVLGITNDISSSLNWASGNLGKRLGVIFYGVTDSRVDNLISPGVAEFQVVRATGGIVDFWLYDNTDLNDTVPIGTTGIAGRSGAGGYTGLTTQPSSVLAMRLLMTPGAVTEDLATTYTATFNLLSGVGQGRAFMNIDETVGLQSWIDFFNTNGIADQNGVFRDFGVDFTGSTQGIGQTITWTLGVTGQVRGGSIPLPGTLLLIGAGLLGFGARRHWRRV